MNNFDVVYLHSSQQDVQQVSSSSLIYRIFKAVICVPLSVIDGIAKSPIWSFLIIKGHLERRGYKDLMLIIFSLFLTVVTLPIGMPLITAITVLVKLMSCLFGKNTTSWKVSVSYE